MGIRVATAIALWVLANGGAFAALTQYKGVGGAIGEVPASWPPESRLELADDRPTMIFAAHPRCACTRASIAELARLVSEVKAQIRIHVLFVRPEGVSDEWMSTDTWDSAKIIPGADVREDAGGAEAALFGARTSGHVVLFAPDGKRLFGGGITGSRGHEGENAGLARAISAVKTGQALGSTSVFGCGLGEEAAKEGT